MVNRLYVAYGSNLNIRQMAMRCPTAKLIGTGTVNDYELQFKGNPHGAYATIGVHEGSKVPVGVWKIGLFDEKSLDSYEGYPSHYYKKNIPVVMDSGEELTAMVYIMNQKMDFGIPTHRYYNAVYEGYENCGLDVKILNAAVDKSIETYRSNQKLSDELTAIDESDYDEYYDSDEENETEMSEDDPYDLSGQMYL